MWRDVWETEKARYQPPTRLGWAEFIDKLPDTLPDALDVNVIGGLTRNGFTERDVDLMIPNPNLEEVNQYKYALRAMVREVYGRHLNLGNHVWAYVPLPIPIQLYDAGVLRDRQSLKGLVVELADPTPSKKLADVEFRQEMESRIQVIEDQLGLP